MHLFLFPEIPNSKMGETKGKIKHYLRENGKRQKKKKKPKYLWIEGL
jgi:hypothetical protein